MTELELRKQVVATAKLWLGRKEADGSHKEIIDVYNSICPLPVGYKMKYTDYWCAAFVSAVAQKLGLMGTAEHSLRQEGCRGCRKGRCRCNPHA